jgi:hypothetical protein
LWLGSCYTVLTVRKTRYGNTKEVMFEDAKDY